MAIKFLSGLNLSNVTAGSILKLDSNGNIVAAVDGTDYNTAAGAWSDVSSNIYRNSDVRIGTFQSGVAPAARLHVFDYQTTDPKLLIEDGNTGDASMEFKISTQSYTMGIDNSDSDKFVIAASTALGTTNVLEISTAGAAAFQAGLLVDGGSAMFDTDGGNNPLYIARNSSTSESLKIYVNDTEAFFESIQDETGGDHGRFAFKMDGDSPSAYTRWLHGNTERMRLTAGGNLGIGITDPDVALEVGGTIKASTHADGLVFGSPTTVKFKLGVYGGNDLLFKDPNNNVLMTLTSAGNVGFAGSVSIQSDNEERFLVRSNDYTISRIISRGNSGADLDKGLFSLMSSDGTNNNVEVVRLDSASNSWLNGGNVGIGTDSPSYGLDVNHNAARIGSSSQTTTSLYLTATNTDGAPAIATQIIMQGYEGRAKGTFYTDSGADGEWFDGVPYNGNHNYWQVGFDETGGQAEYSANAILRVRDNGNVGIGVANPQQKLDVAGVIKGEGSIRVDSSATGSPYFGLYQGGSEKAYLQYVDTGDSLVLQSDGEVVIRGDVQHGQGDADAVISFKQSTNELGKFDQDGYLYATGFKTSGTTGFLKSDGTVATGSFFSGAYNDLSGKPTLGTMAAAATSDYKTSDATETYVALELASYTLTSALGTAATSASTDFFNLDGTAEAGFLNLQQNTVGTTFGDGVSTAPSYYFGQKVGDNDGWRLYGEAPASNDVKMIFEIIDDIEGGDTWVFRNKKTYNPYTANDVVKIGGEGNITTSGKLFIGTTSATTTATTALLLGASGEVKKRSLGSNAFNSTSFLSLAGGTITGQVIFPSASTTKPVLPNGYIARNDNSDTDGTHDIWGISERYYPSNETDGDAWGIQWSGTPNEINFIGAGQKKLSIDLDTAGTVKIDGNAVATESYVGTQISNLVDSSPAALNTLNELAAALGNDSSFSTTMSTALGNRLRIDVNNQSLSSTELANARTNLGLGTAATAASTSFVAVSGDSMTGNLGINSSTPQAPLDVQPNSSYKVTKVGDDRTSHYKLTGLADHTLTLACTSYHSSEVVITAHQTNGGTNNNLYIRGIWTNNHTAHHWHEIENIGGLSGSSFTITNGQSGSTTNSGELEIVHDYSSGSFAQMVVRVTDHYGTHSYTIS